MRYSSTKQNLQGWQLQSFLSSLPFWDALGGCVQWSRRERRKLWNFSKRRKSLVDSGLLGWRRWRGAWHCSKPDSGANRSREKWSRTCTCVNAAQHGLELDLRDSIHIFRLLYYYREPTLRRVCWAAVTNCAPVTSLMTQTRCAVGFTRWHSADRKLQVANRFKPQVDIQFVKDLGLIFENIRPGRGRGLISGG